MAPILRTFLKRLRILPVLIAVAMLAFFVRIGDAVLTYKNLSGEAVAAESSPEMAMKAPGVPALPEFPKMSDATAEAVGTQPGTAPLKSPEEAPPAGADKEKSSPDDVTLPSMDQAAGDKKEEAKDESKGGQDSGKVWEDANDLDPAQSAISDDMYKDMVERRKQLDAREKAVAQREALLEAGQKELDRKYKELTGLRDEIQGLLKTQSEQENARLNSLVKIYTSMKPKDAARIFDTLDMDILAEVVGAMPEGKSASIIAAMDADRARALTTLLAEQKKLPDVP